MREMDNHLLMERNSYLNISLKWITLVLGIALIILGTIVIIGWHTDTKLLLQITPEFVAMVYNTALGFVLSGISLLALVKGNKSLVLLCAGIVSVIGLLTLVEYQFDFDLGIDQFFIEHYIHVKTSSPGRPAPNTALCFTLAGIALILAQQKIQNWLLASALGSIVTGLGIIAFTGYLVGFESAYGWGNLTRMAVHTALGFVLLGAGVLAFCWIQSSKDTDTPKNWLAIPAGFLVITITVSLWQAFHVKEMFVVARYFILIFGIILAVIVSYTLYLLQQSKRYASDLAKLHNVLEFKVEERTRELHTVLENLDLAMEAAQMGAWSWDLVDDRIIWDDNMYQLFDLEPGSFHGRQADFLKLLYPDDRERVKKQIEESVVRLSVYDTDYRVIWQDGSIHYIASRGKAYQDDSGKIISRRGVSWDITEQKKFEVQLKVSERRTQAILDNAVDGIITIDEQGIIESFNTSAERMFGYSKEEVTGKNIRLLMPEPYHSEHDQYLANYRHTGKRKIIGIGKEVLGQGKNGNTFPVDLAVSEVFTENGRIFTGILRDITERKRIEEQLRETKEAAEAANVAKSRFMANMSHELRTPLNAIIGYSEMLSEDAAEAGQQELMSDLNKIQASGKHLLGLINDILDLSKIEAGKLELLVEPFSVTALVNEVSEMVQPLVEKRGNILEVINNNNLEEMESDQTKLRQVLFNLLSNAAKFTSNGSITLTISNETMNDQDWLTFKVSDTGIGMDSTQLGHIFEEFKQADRSTTRDYGGTGLGLTISRKLCQMMQGDISVKSVSGEGSTFTVQVPLLLKEESVETGNQPGSSPEPYIAPNEAGPLVLVIDDELHARELMTRHLRKAGYQVALAADGREGIALARQLKPLAITLDVVMPGMDGWEVMQVLKADPDLTKIPIVMCTVIDDEEHAFSLGVAEYLTKPVDHKRLQKTLESRCPGGNCRILIVEDDTVQRQLISRELQNDGWQVFEAEHGRAAMERLREKTVDIVLLDLEMPEMDGFEFVEAIQKNPVWRDIPVVVLTGKDLTSADRSRLNGYVKTIIAKGNRGLNSVIGNIQKVLKDRVNHNYT
ncbi:MAG TPA: response regulator [Gammaproteobacteria bacterium]|nr:response regulator [Gammaproteobacteria bacterium]